MRKVDNRTNTQLKQCLFSPFLTNLITTAIYNQNDFFLNFGSARQHSVRLTQDFLSKMARAAALFCCSILKNCCSSHLALHTVSLQHVCTNTCTGSVVGGDTYQVARRRSISSAAKRLASFLPVRIHVWAHQMMRKALCLYQTSWGVSLECNHIIASLYDYAIKTVSLSVYMCTFACVCQHW